MGSFDVTTEYMPGAIGRVVALHARCYAEHWSLGPSFEAKVATEPADFIGSCDEAKDHIWLLAMQGTIEGSITIDDSSQNRNVAPLR